MFDIFVVMFCIISHIIAMVSKKKRPPPALDSSEVVVKKTKTFDGAGTSSSGSAMASSKSSASKKHTKSKEAELASLKGNAAVEDLPVRATNSGRNGDFPDWPQGDLMELMKRIEINIPPKDNLRFDSRTEKLEWEKIRFGDYSAKQCKEMWGQIQKRLRRFRLLKELLEDAKSWVSKPWTHFYRSSKLNRHPDMPRRPLTSYMLFYVEKKDKVAKENPGLEMTAVSKVIADLYKNLPEKKKQKYIDMAATQRKEYEEKMEKFNQEHPELASKERKSTPVVRTPRKPTPPFKLFWEDKLNQHKNEPDFDRAALLEKCKEQWRTMADKKKVVWINWALEEEARYLEELKVYTSENPNFVPTVKAVLTKEEKILKERVAGKPEKPPNSGYSLFSRLMLVSPDIKKVAPKERMLQIALLWKTLPDTQKKKYQEQVTHMLDQYKLEYATYLESLPEDERKEELKSNQPKRKPPKPKSPTLNQDGPKKPKVMKKATKEEEKRKPDNKVLFKGEPEPPPVNAYQLFLKSFVNTMTHINAEYREKEAPRYWQMLPDSDKAKYRKKLTDIKGKYIADYEKFLKSLSQEQLKDYSLLKASLKKEETAMESSEDSDSDDESDSSDNQQESGSDSSSDSDDSDDSSESNESGGDEKNNESEDSSSSASESD